jgi:hypothetical protein
VVAAVARRQDLVRLVTTAGSDSEYAPGAEHVHAILEHLAVVGTDGDANLHRTLDLLGRRSNGGGALVAVVAEVPAEDLRALQLLRARFGSVTVVQVDRSAWDTAVRASPAPDASAVRITRDAPFKVAWEQHVRMLADGRTRLGVGR